jgi:putative transposase
MPYRGTLFTPGSYYHLYNRGANRSRIFLSPANYDYCIRLMQQCCHRYGVTMIAYCLMPTHYHFLARQDSEQPLSRFVNVLFNGYTQALNRQQNRTGTLFEGRFCHVLVDRDEYLTHLCRYIHLNPVRAGLVAGPREWAYSDYGGWVSDSPDAFVREHFDDGVAYEAFVSDYQDELKAQAKLNRYLFD